MDDWLSDLRDRARAGVVGNAPDNSALKAVARAESWRHVVAPILASALSGPRLPAETVYSAFGTYGPDENSIRDDVGRYVERDFASSSPFEVVTLSNGFHVLYAYRLAHALFASGERYSARLVQLQMCRNLGADIHPAATLGHRVFLDHALGLVIGETASLGDDSTLFHGVTLGGTGKQPGVRHPQLGKRVVVGAGAALIGSITIGDETEIAPNTVVTESVPPRSRIRPARAS